LKVNAGNEIITYPELAIPRKIKRRLNTRFIGKQIHFFGRIDSTNIAARKLAELGANEGTVVLAESQSKGKGRMGRLWQSPPGNLYTSIVLRPQIHPSSAPQVTLMAALATAKAIDKTVQIKVGVKWPNDILIHGKKVAGILTEMDCEGGNLNFIVLGIGVNINAPLNLFPRELLNSITTLREEAVGNISLAQFTSCLYQEIERYYDLWKAKGFSWISNEYTKLLLLKGKVVRIFSFDQVTSGEVQGIDEKGGLLLRLPNSRVESITAGDVTLKA
jgi:BirA family biotin operon repressor/biotin-[acetyl-CoA-carboxylase] ligase